MELGFSFKLDSNFNSEPSNLNFTSGTNNTLTLVDVQLGAFTITVKKPVEYVGTYRSDIWGNPLNTALLEAGPICLVSPKLSGSLGFGETLYARPGLWVFDGENSNPTISYTWKSDGELIENQTLQELTISTENLGTAISVTELVDGGNGTHSATSISVGIPTSGTAFNPINLNGSTLAAWWDASDLTDGKVPTWPDKSSNLVNLAQSDTLKRPTMVDGHISFAQENSEHLRNNNGAFLYDAAPMVLFLILRGISSDLGSIISEGGVSSALEYSPLTTDPSGLFVTNDGAAARIIDDENTAILDEGSFSNSGIFDGAWHIVEIVDTGSNIKFSTELTLIQAHDYSRPPSSAFSVLSVGAHGYGVLEQTNSCSFLLREIVALSGTDPTQISDIRTYLQTKHGIW